MTLHFPESGLYFPAPLVDSLMDGDVVFFCGAGISSPQLPNFCELVKRTCEELDFELVEESSERKAFDNGRFEEVLGALHRRLADPDEVIRVISKLLEIRENPCLENHRTLLRLSGDIENKICIVTTNFDTLLERAAAKIFDNEEEARKISFATRSLPLPGSSAFSGIMHIHGRLEDPKLELEKSQLVLTSADYSDAYMRPGWASRFLFDLARCKTIVLIGYSANDIPIRYFLNGLEIERQRFPDVKQVYAFYARDRGPETTQRKSEESWEMLPVIPLPYWKTSSDSQESDHMLLWRDLEKLADAVEHQARYRQDRVRTILHGSVAEFGIKVYNELDWLFDKPRDIRSIPFDAIDPDWFKYFRDKRLWLESDLIQMIAIWVSDNFQDGERFKYALKWQDEFERPFTKAIQRFLRSKKGLDETWARVWHLFCFAESTRSDREDYYAIKGRFANAFVFENDLQKAVNLLAPKPKFRLDYHKFKEEYCKLLGQTYDNTISDPHSWLASGHMNISDSHVSKDLLDSLRNMPEHSVRILEIATLELQSALALQAYFVQDERKNQNSIEYDPNDWQVPSIEGHKQNQSHGGVNFLIQAIVNCVPQAKKLDPDYTRAIILGWKRFPGRIGLRLCLHAMRDTEFFSGDDAMSALLSISIVDFWSIDREVPLLLRDQAGNASPKVLRRVERRILKSGASYYKRFSIEQDQDDWRRPAHDTAVWICLKMLQKSNSLSKAGIVKLSAIVKRRGHLNREVKDQDLFGHYRFDVRRVVGDPKAIMDTPEDNRLQMVRKLADSSDLDVRQGWPAFCGIDPQGAFKILSKENFTEKDSLLWIQLLNCLRSCTEQNKEVCEEVSIQAMNHLYQIDEKSLLSLASELCSLISFVSRKKIPNFNNWLLKLWELVKQLPDEPVEFLSDVYQKAINLPPGELSQILLKEISAQSEKGMNLDNSLRDLIRSVSTNTAAAGYFGCCVFARNLKFLFTIERQCVIENLVPRIREKNDAGAGLRGAMLRGEITPEISSVLKNEILTGVIENGSDEHLAEDVVVNIFCLTLAILKNDGKINEWKMTPNEMKRALQRAGSAIRGAMLATLAEWLSIASKEGENAWDQVAVPFFRKIWPKEQEFVSSTFTSHMISLVLAAGQKFPEALKLMRPYIRPYDQEYVSLHEIENSEVLEKFPHEALELIWLACGPRSRGGFDELPNIIRKLVEACPNIGTKRRLQWLKRQARYDES